MVQGAFLFCLPVPPAVTVPFDSFFRLRCFQLAQAFLSRNSTCIALLDPLRLIVESQIGSRRIYARLPSGKLFQKSYLHAKALYRYRFGGKLCPCCSHISIVLLAAYSLRGDNNLRFGIYSTAQSSPLLQILLDSYLLCSRFPVRLMNDITFLNCPPCHPEFCGPFHSECELVYPLLHFAHGNLIGYNMLIDSDTDCGCIDRGLDDSWISSSRACRSAQSEQTGLVTLSGSP